MGIRPVRNGSQTYPSGKTVSYTYDAAGRTASFSGNLGDGANRSYASEIIYSSLGGIGKEKFGTIRWFHIGNEMTTLFSVFYEGFSASNTGQLRVDRKWGLPGVTCSVCQETWARTGVAYPSVDLTNLPDEPQYRRFWPVSLEEFEERRRPILGLIPDGSKPPPGTDFGPLVGTGRGGPFADFVWVNSWTLLAQSSALERLRTADVKLPKTVQALIRFNKPNHYVFVELELEPRTRMARSAFGHDLPQCKACGRVGATMPDNIVIQQSSIPSDVDIFRDRLMTTLILATDRFVQAVKRLQLTGLEFREVQTV